MDDRKIKNLLEDIEDFNLPMTKCDDLQKIINYCQENYDYWREIKLCYSFFYNHDQSIFFDISDFNLDNKNRVLELICDDKKDSNFTVLNLEKLLNFIKSDDQNWNSIIVTCESLYNPASCYVDEEKRKICFVSP